MSHFLSFCQENKKIDAGICEIGNTEVVQLLKVLKKKHLVWLALSFSYHNVHTDQYQPDMILGSTENDCLRLL